MPFLIFVVFFNLLGINSFIAVALWVVVGAWLFFIDVWKIRHRDKNKPRKSFFRFFSAHLIFSSLLVIEFFVIVFGISGLLALFVAFCIIVSAIWLAFRHAEKEAYPKN